METSVIAGLLEPFIQLDETRLRSISTYIDLLLKWNARINLTAVRQPEEMVRRHFGESFFAGKYLLEQGPVVQAIDLGSGAGFPGVPLALLAPDTQVTLIESQQKKATFLKELIRSLGLKNVLVFGDRAESYSSTADLVMLRAVEKFERSVKVASDLVEPAGRLTLLIGQLQVPAAKLIASEMQWLDPIAVPDSQSRVILMGTKS